MLHFNCFIPNSRLRLASDIFHKVNWIDKSLSRHVFFNDLLILCVYTTSKENVSK